MWVTEACVYQADRIMHQTPSEDSDCGYRRPRHRRNHLQRNRPGNGAYLVYEGHNNYFAALLYYFDLSLLSYITQMGWTEMEWTRTQSSPVPLWGTIGGRYHSHTGMSYAAMPVLLPCPVRRTWSPWCPTEGRYTHQGQRCRNTPFLRSLICPRATAQLLPQEEHWEGHIRTQVEGLVLLESQHPERNIMKNMCLWWHFCKNVIMLLLVHFASVSKWNFQ